MAKPHNDEFDILRGILSIHADGAMSEGLYTTKLDDACLGGIPSQASMCLHDDREIREK